MSVTKCSRRRLLPTLAAAVLGAGLCNAKIEWSETTSSSSDYVLDAEVGELITVSHGIAGTRTQEQRKLNLRQDAYQRTSNLFVD